MPAPAHHRTIRFRLGLAVALALTPVLLLGVMQSVNEFQRDADARLVALSQAARRSAVVASARIRASTVMLEILSPQAVGPSCAPQLSRLMERSQGYLNVIRFDALGRVRCAGADVTGADAPREAEWFSRLRNGEHMVVTRAPAGLYGAEPALLAATRAEDETGRFDGAMVAVLRLTSLQIEAGDPAAPNGTTVALVDRDGRAIVAERPEAFAAPPPEWRLRAKAANGLVFTARAGEGERRVHAVRPLIEDQVYVVLSAPRPGLLFWARLNPVASIILPLLAWLAAWAAVTVVSEGVVIRWLAYLERIAAIYARGRYSVRPVQGATKAPAEIRALARSLEAMADAIVQRDTSLRESLAHKDALMREIHHRVKNNLQVITSLLNMQQRALSDPAARAAMSDTRQRINALALIYRALYQSPDLRRVDVRQFLEELVASLTSGEGLRSPPLRTELTADDLEIDPDKLAPLALFAVEAISEARRGAPEDRISTIRVRLAADPQEIRLEIISDRQIALPADEAGVGRTLMAAFARQLRGRHELIEGPDGGATARLIFPGPAAVALNAPGAPPSADPPANPPSGPGGNRAAA